MVSSVAQRLDAPLVHIGPGQVEVGDLVYGTQRACDRFSVAPRCLPAVDEREQRVMPAIVRGGVGAIQCLLRRGYRYASRGQINSQR